MILLELAGTVFALTVADSELRGWVNRRFSPFACTAAPSWHVEVRVTGPAPPYLHSPLQIHNEACTVHEERDAFSVVGRTFTGGADLKRRQAWVSGPRASYPFDALLRYLLPVALADSFVVHSAMLAEEGRGFLCAGPSGSGKSTLAGLLPAAACSDELAAITLASGSPRAHSLPFWQARARSARLGGVFLLSHARTHTRRRVAPAAAVRSLLPHVLWPVACTAALQHTFDCLARMAATVPVWELGFAPNPDVWQHIAGAG